MEPDDLNALGLNAVFVYVTHPDSESARRVAAHLLEKRLIACANFLPIESMYRWRGKIENDREVVTILKTAPGNWDRVREEIVSIHPYEVPCIVRLEATAHEPFARYLREETGSR